MFYSPRGAISPTKQGTTALRAKGTQALKSKGYVNTKPKPTSTAQKNANTLGQVVRGFK